MIIESFEREIIFKEDLIIKEIKEESIRNLEEHRLNTINLEKFDYYPKLNFKENDDRKYSIFNKVFYTFTFYGLLLFIKYHYHYRFKHLSKSS